MAASGKQMAPTPVRMQRAALVSCQQGVYCEALGNQCGGPLELRLDLSPDPAQQSFWTRSGDLSSADYRDSHIVMSSVVLFTKARRQTKMLED